jgi:hypothetical protein
VVEHPEAEDQLIGAGQVELAVEVEPMDLDRRPQRPLERGGGEHAQVADRLVTALVDVHLEADRLQEERQVPVGRADVGHTPLLGRLQQPTVVPRQQVVQMPDEVGQHLERVPAPGRRLGRCLGLVQPTRKGGGL